MQQTGSQQTGSQQTGSQQTGSQQNANKESQATGQSAHQAGAQAGSDNSRGQNTEMSSDTGGRKASVGKAGSQKQGTVEKKSIGAMIGQSLAEESQDGVERLLTEVKENFEMAKEYIAENPREAAGLAVCAAAVTWALLGTKPGRQLFEAGSAIAVPYATKWVARNFSAKH